MSDVARANFDHASESFGVCTDPDCEIHHPEVIEDEAERLTALAYVRAALIVAEEEAGYVRRAAETSAVGFLLDGLEVATLRELARLVAVAREAEALGDQVRAGERLVAIFDTSALTGRERACLAGEVTVQAERSPGNFGFEDGHPDVRVAVAAS